MTETIEITITIVRMDDRVFIQVGKDTRPDSIQCDRFEQADRIMAYLASELPERIGL